MVWGSVQSKFNWSTLLHLIANPGAILAGLDYNFSDISLKGFQKSVYLTIVYR